MDVEHKCHVCNKVFANKRNLVRHQQTAQYCLDIAGTKVKKLSCKYCEKYTTQSQYNLNRHMATCPMKDRFELTMQMELVKMEEKYNALLELKEEYKKIYDKPRVINNTQNITFNMQEQYSLRVLSQYEELKNKMSDIVNN